MDFGNLFCSICSFSIEIVLDFHDFAFHEHFYCTKNREVQGPPVHIYYLCLLKHILIVASCNFKNLAWRDKNEIEIFQMVRVEVGSFLWKKVIKPFWKVPRCALKFIPRLYWMFCSITIRNFVCQKICFQSPWILVSHIFKSLVTIL